MKCVDRLLPVLALGVLTTQCGTQVGDPNAAGFTRLTQTSGSLSTLVNAAFLQTIDSLNMGDYAYSTAESRVSTDRSCQQAGTNLSLVDKAESNHTVIDDTAQWYAKSDLSIKRSYQDAWTQNGVLLACNAATRSVNFPYEKLQQGPIRLQSRVDESLSRTLALNEKQLGRTINHKLILGKTGQRTLDFVSYQENGKEVLLAVELQSQLSSSIEIPAADIGETGTETARVTMTQQDRFPLEYLIAIDQSDQWTRYQIPNGQQEFELPETGEQIKLEFRNLVLTRANGCVPTSGQLAVTATHADQTATVYTLSFQTKGPLLLKREGSNDSLILAPFACVLKER